MNAIDKIKKLITTPNTGEAVTIYFIGVGGIGMSALARYFISRNAIVKGYDRSITPLTQQLEKEGIDIHYTDSIDLAPKDADLVVYTPAIPKDHLGLNYFRENGYDVVKRSDVLQWITENSFNICIAGTHGKTTITTMTAHVLRHSGYGCNAFLGGISANYETNFWSSKKNVAVIEADEYDRSFLKLVPDVAVITSMDADHLDIYGTPEEMENAFIQFSKKVKPTGCLISKHDLKRSKELNAAHHYTYSFDDVTADVYATNVDVENGSYVFDIKAKEWQIERVLLHMGGLHNIENSLVAITIAKYLDIEDKKIKKAIEAFKGVKRRFEYILNQRSPAHEWRGANDEGHVLIDDYAHHPEELKALISGVKSLFVDDECVVIFQPHLYSRTKDLAPQFAEALDMADQVILLPVYPARELPVEGVESELIMNEMKLPQKEVMTKEAMQDWVKIYKPRLLVMCGAGDIDEQVMIVKEILS